MRAAIEEIAKRMDLPVENLVSPDPIRQLCFEPAGTDLESIQVQLAGLGVRSWQRNAISHEVAKALAEASSTS